MLVACASPPQALLDGGTADASVPDLSCTLPSNCVNSLGSGGLPPLRYEGSSAQAQELLRSTLATFAEARVIRSEPLALVAIFTTPVGFQDQVDFRLDPQAQRIHFRSRSLLGLYDFGKNRSRMEAFSTRFDQKRAAPLSTGSPA